MQKIKDKVKTNQVREHNWEKELRRRRRIKEGRHNYHKLVVKKEEKVKPVITEKDMQEVSYKLTFLRKIWNRIKKLLGF